MSFNNVPAAGNNLAVVNQNFDAAKVAAVYGKNAATTSGLTWGYLGGRWGGNAIAAGTLSLTDSNTNYVVVARSNGAVSVSTSATNWNDTTNYARAYKLTTSGGAVTAEEDHRAGLYGTHGASAAAGAAELRGLTFTSDTDSTADSDPGNGLFKWNHATQGSATVLYFDNQTADAVSLTTFWGNLGSAGFIHLQQADDATKWQRWRWSGAPADGTGYRKFTVTLQAMGGVIADAKTVLCEFFSEDGAGIGGGASNVIPIPAAAILPKNTNGCSTLQLMAGSTTARPDVAVVYLDPSSAEYFTLPPIPTPVDWDGTFTFHYRWRHAATTTNFTVRIGMAALSVGNDDSLDQDVGSEVTVDDTGGTTADEYISSESSAVTPANSPAAGDTLHIIGRRVISGVTGNMAIDMALIQVVVTLGLT